MAESDRDAGGHSGTAGAIHESADGGKAEISQQQLDRLAGQLYSRLRTRLVNELRLDRERAGHLSDPW